MAVVIPPLLAAADMLCSLGLGFLLALGCDLVRLVLGENKAVLFFLDLFAAFAAAVLLCSFAAGRSFSGQVRWYMTAALLAGFWSYFSVLAPAAQTLRKTLVWILTRPFALLYILTVKPLIHCFMKALRRFKRKMKQTALKCSKKQLKKQAQVLYNSNN